MLRYKWLLLSIAIVSGITAFAIHGRFSAVYEPEAKVWISPSEDGQQRAGPVRAAALLPSSSWGDLLTSYAVLGQVVRELHTYVRPLDPRNNSLFSIVDVNDVVRPGLYTLNVDSVTRRYTLSITKAGHEQIVERGTIADSIGGAVGLRWSPDTTALLNAGTVSFALYTPRQASQQLREQIRSVVPREGNIMHVYVAGPDAWLVTRTLNSVVRHLVLTAGELKRRNLTDVREALETQLAYAGKALQTADDALERFRMETITLPSEAGTPINGGVAITRNPAITNYFNLKLTLENTSHERGVLEETLNDVKAGRVDVSAMWQVLPTDINTQEISSLLQEYTKRSTELRNAQAAFTDSYQGVKDARAAIAQLKDREIPRAVTTVVDQLRRRETDLASEVGTGSASLKEIPSRTIEEVRLTRNAEARGQLYGMLQGRYEEAHLAELSVEPDLAVLDSAAMPEFPILNRGRQLGLMVIAGGLLAAVLLALVLDRLDKRIRYTHQVTQNLRLNVIGAVPHAAQRRTPKPLDVMQLIESFRLLRLNVSYAATNDRQLMLTVTSAGPGEGKSLVSANLALSFAGGGFRTLLVDGDLRRGRLHTTFATDRRPGLVDVLRGTVPLNECLRPTSEPSLTLLPSGSRLTSAPELLTSVAFQQLMKTLQADYDVILIDSPPLAAGMDPYALCVSTGNALFVVRLAKTDGEIARQRLESLERFPVNVVGAVINDIQPAGGLNTEYAYLPGYAIHDEDDMLTTAEDEPAERSAVFNYRSWPR
ncbi:MAG TPA: polysaccharide biosynthesis tyrosine autokinase [Gemmatimonadaceae bacterium]|jgi:capsular exopolysaccharide synthesis family protein